MQLYKRRHFMLVVMAEIALLNNAIFVSFAPIAEETKTFFNISYFWVNALSWATVISDFALFIPALYVIRKWGCRGVGNIHSFLSCLPYLLPITFYPLLPPPHPSSFSLLPPLPYPHTNLLPLALLSSILHFCRLCLPLFRFPRRLFPHFCPHLFLPFLPFLSSPPSPDNLTLTSSP